MLSLFRRHPQAALILAAFVTLAVIYSLVNPSFEAGDESRHYAVVKYMADTGRLPVQQPGEAQIHWSHEGNQPPLYYAMAAALTFWIETGDWEDVYWYNPHAAIGVPLRPDNKNMVIHPPGQGWQGHVLAVHLIRLLSIGMATVTVTAAYLIALRLFRGRRWPAAGAMAITAFNPMFIFISASVNNDNAVIMFVTLALWLMVRLAEAPLKPGGPLRAAALLGLLIGLGGLSKLYALGLPPLAGLLFLARSFRPEAASASRHSEPQHPSRHSEPHAFSCHSEAFFAEESPRGHTGEDSSLPAKRVTQNDMGKSFSQERSPFHLTGRLWRYFLKPTLVMAAVALAVGGWFYLRNALLYEGDWLALNIMRDTAGRRTEAPTLATLRAEFQGFRIAYWALFGGVNVLVDEWIYTALDGVSLAAFIGLAGFFLCGLGILIWPPSSSPRRGEDQIAPPRRGGLREGAAGLTRLLARCQQGRRLISLPVFGLLLGWGLIMGTGFIAWNLTQPAGQGRLLYPAIAVISPLGLLGLIWWLPSAAQKGVIWLSMAGLFLFALLAPFLYIGPAYARPPLLSRADLPPDIEPVNYLYDGAIRLIGYKLHAHTVRPAESLPLTLYWELVEPVDLDYSIYVHLLGRERQPVGQIDTYPGSGQWPTRLLTPGDIVADRYAVPVIPEAEFTHAPARLLIAAGIYDLREPGLPGKPAVDAAGNRVEPIIAAAKLIPWQWPDPPRMAHPIDFAGKAALLSYRIEPAARTVTFNWETRQRFEADYTVFIQAWQGETYITGFDGPPVGGDYPTSLWAPGEIIVDTHPLDLSRLPPGEYTLLAGLYRPDTGQRLPAFGPDGPLPDYTVRLGTVQGLGD